MREKIIAVFKREKKDLRPIEVTEILAKEGTTSSSEGGLSLMVNSALIKGRDKDFERVEKGVYRLKQTD